MPLPSMAHAALSLLMLGSTVALTVDTAPAPPEPPAGQLLIAAATLPDPRFHHAVILLVRHDRNGAFGVIINRRLAKRRLAEILKDADDAAQEDATIEGDVEVFFGGPVQPQLGFLIHSTEYHLADTIAVGDVAALTASRDALRDLGHHRGPAKSLFTIGYAGWGAGQLEGEIARRDWFTTPAEPGLIFDAERATLWETALARRTREL